MDTPPLFHVDGGPPLPAGTAEWLTSRAGRRLRVARFVPNGTARGSVVLSTGRTEPIEKYGEVAVDLVARGFVVLLHDWAGQGLSERFSDDRLRCDLIGGASTLVADYTDILNAYAERLPKPWLACAHSMGAGLTSLALVEGESRFAAAVLCAPLVQFLAGALPFWVIRTIVRAVSSASETVLARKQLAPSAVRFEDNLLTHDRGRYERTAALYRAHPELQVGEPTYRWLAFAVELHDRLTQPGAAERISCPVAVLGAGDDRIVSTEAVRRFARRVPRGSYSEVRGSFHEILMETDERRAEYFRVFDRVAAEVLGAG